MINVKEILKRKGKEVWSIVSDAMAYKALEIMAEKDVGALMVIDDGKLVGIFSERDYARKVVLKGKESHQISVSEIMCKDVVCVDLTSTVEECMQLMTEKHIRHLPVKHDDQVIGIVTIGDIVKQIIAAQKDTIGHLESYITGGFGG